MAEQWLEHLADEAATQALGTALARSLEPGLVIFLEGKLGTGKTTLARALLVELGFDGIVRSPTYTLLEPYRIGDWRVVHLDLYRINDPEELENIGLRDELDGQPVVLVEWPSQGHGHLPAADLWISLSHDPPGRRLCIKAATPKGAMVLARMGEKY